MPLPKHVTSALQSRTTRNTESTMLKHRQTAGTTVFVPPVSKTDSAKHLLAARQAALNQQYLINKRIAMTRGLGRLPASNMPRITTRKRGSIGQMASGRTRTKRSSRFKQSQRIQISAQAKAQQKQRDEAAAKKRAEVLAAAKKRAESDIAAAKKKAEEEAAIVAAARKKKKDEDIAAARKKDEDIAAARKKAEEEVAARKKAEEEAAAKKKAEEEAAARKTKSLFEKTGLKRKNKKKRKKT